MSMLDTLRILALIPLCIVIYVLGSYLRHSFITQKKGLPPYINTYFKHRKLIREKLHLKKGSSILDLGCGDATMLRLFVRRFGCARAVGYDLNGRALYFGRFLNRFHGLLNITLIKDDLRNANLKGFDYIYLFLYPEFVAELEDRIFREADPGTVIICNIFDFVKHKPYEIIYSKAGRKILYLYKV